MEKSIRFSLPVFLAAAFVWTVLIGVEQVQTENVWTVGDWLINYQAGFVRRGLIGEVLFQVADILSLHPSQLVIFVYSACYGVYFFFSYLLLKSQKHLIPFAFLIVSPVTFLFQVHDVPGGFRKEILFFALLALLVYVARTKPLRYFEIAFYTIVAFFPLVILTHEMLAVWLPYFVVVYILKVHLTPKRIFWTTLILLLNAAALWFSSSNSGDMITAAKISLTLAPDGAPWLNGAIRALADNPSRAFGATQATIVEKNYFAVYAIFSILTALAFVPVWRILAPVFKNPLILVLILASVLGTAVLLMIASDWGRFIYIHAVSFFLLTLLIAPKIQSDVARKTIGAKRQLLLVFLMAIYAGIWFLPHHGVPSRDVGKNYLVLKLLDNI